MSPQIPSYRKHRPSGQAVVTLSGKDFYLGPWKSTDSRLAYERLIGEWLANNRQLPQIGAAGTLSINELLAAYLAFAKQYYSRDGQPGPEYVAMKDAIRPVFRLYGEKAVHEFGPLSLKSVREAWIEQGLSRRFINTRVNRIRRVFKFGVENELVPAHILQALQAVAPLRRGRTPAQDLPPVQPVADEHVDPVLPLVSRQVAAMIQLQRLSGARPGEIVLLRPVDIDRSKPIWVYRPQRHKTDYRGHDREIFFGPKAQEILTPWLLRPAEAYCFSPAEAEAERNASRREQRKTRMTPSQARRRPKGKPKRAKRERYDRDSYRRAVEYGIKKAGVPHWFPHQLRHSCGTHMRQKFGLDVAQIILGHRSATVTEIYAEADRKRGYEVMREVG